jgi:hypothetical protein
MIGEGLERRRKSEISFGPPRNFTSSALNYNTTQDSTVLVRDRRFWGRRILRSGWDVYGGMPHTRILWDIAAVLDPPIERALIRPLSAPNELARLWAELGFLDVEQTSLLIRTEFSCFGDYWLPFTRGEGPPGQFAASLSDTARSALQEHMRRAYLVSLPDRPRSFACVAWAGGTVPA